MKFNTMVHQHIFETEKYFAQCHASTIEKLPNGELVSAWFAGSHESNPDVAIWFSKKNNGSTGWEEPVKIADKDNVACWNPVLFWNKNKDELVLYYKVGKYIPTWQTFYKISKDYGNTWSQEKEMVAGDIGGRGPVKNKCITLDSGRILAPASVEVKNEKRKDGSLSEDWDCFVDYSDDNGETWKKSGLAFFDQETKVDRGIIQPTLWVDVGGNPNMYMRSTEGAIFHSVSKDNGKTWSKAKRTKLPNNNCGIDIAKLSDGRLVLIYNPVSVNVRTPIAFSISENDGKSWSKPEVLDHVPADKNIDSAEFSYPAIVADGNDVHITYTWRRRTITYWHINFPEKNITKKDKIKDGAWVTMITPFTKEKKIDYPALENMVNWYIKKGIDGLFAVCQSSEMFFLSLEERVSLAESVVKYANGRIPVIASGHVSDKIEDQLEEIKAISKTGIDAFVLVSNRLANENEGDDVFKKNVEIIINEVPDIPFGLYECPYPYKRLMAPELLKWCADTGRFLFHKDTSCNIDEIKEKIDAIRDTDLKFYNANATTLLESLKYGGNGYSGVMANFHPELYRWICKTAMDDRQYGLLAQSLASITSLIELKSYPVNAKYNMNLQGIPMELFSRAKDINDISNLEKEEVKNIMNLVNYVKSQLID